jgi:hypothetical protein
LQGKQHVHKEQSNQKNRTRERVICATTMTGKYHKTALPLKWDKDFEETVLEERLIT